MCSNNKFTPTVYSYYHFRDYIFGVKVRHRFKMEYHDSLEHTHTLQDSFLVSATVKSLLEPILHTHVSLCFDKVTSETVSIIKFNWLLSSLPLTYLRQFQFHLSKVFLSAITQSWCISKLNRCGKNKNKGWSLIQISFQNLIFTPFSNFLCKTEYCKIFCSCDL